MNKCLDCGEELNNKRSKRCRSCSRKAIKTIKFKCIICGIEKFGLFGQKYCSKECHIKGIGKTSVWKGLPTATVGTIQELRVSVDLLRRGWEVFRALSPSASCDLLILKNNKMIKLEVRTGYEGLGGGNTKRLTYPVNNIKTEYIALGLPEKIVYLKNKKDITKKL